MFNFHQLNSENEYILAAISFDNGCSYTFSFNDRETSSTFAVQLDDDSNLILSEHSDHVPANYHCIPVNRQYFFRSKDGKVCDGIQ